MTITRRPLLKDAVDPYRWSGTEPAVLHAGEEAREQPFTLGVASGDAWTKGFVLWTRLAPRPLEPGVGLARAIYPVGWEVSSDEAFMDIVRSGTAEAHPDLGYTIHVELDGLPSGRRYWYRFMHGGFISSTGTVRTSVLLNLPRLRQAVLVRVSSSKSPVRTPAKTPGPSDRNCR